jgi:hypothetical protein
MVRDVVEIPGIDPDGGNPRMALPSPLVEAVERLQVVVEHDRAENEPPRVDAHPFIRSEDARGRLLEGLGL